MTVWWSQNPSRLSLENESYRRLTGRALSRLSGTTTIVADETFVAGGKRYDTRIIFPDDYPWRAPRALIVSESVPPYAENHVYRDGSLCLHEADEWNPNCTVIWIRGRIGLWLDRYVVFKRSGRWPERR